MHDQLRTRVLALSTVVLGFSTYTYTTFHNNIPKDLIGRFLVTMVAILLIAVFYLVIRMISPRKWQAPMNSTLIPHAYLIHKNKLNYLEYVQQEYLLVISTDTAILRRYSSFFNLSLYLFIISVIIVVVLKEGLAL